MSSNKKIKKKWDKESQNLLDKMKVQRNISPPTFKGYESALKSYCAFTNNSLQNLLMEALKEQDKNIPLRKTKLKKRLLGFRSYLQKEKISQRTMHTYVTKVQTFYRNFEVEIPQLPAMTYDNEYITSYTDLPTQEQILKVCNMVDIHMRAVILFQVSSGSAKAETLSLTVRQFFEGIQEYTDIPFEEDKDTLINILKSLDFNNAEIIPQFYLTRIKTKKWYYTYCTPEAAEAITESLLLRLEHCNHKLKEKYTGSYHNKTTDFLKNKLFNYSSSLLLSRYQEINDSMGWGFKGKYRFFRSHVLRKYNASNIGMVSDDIDAIQGRSKNVVHEAYIKTNPRELKERYKKHMWRVAINPEWRDKMLVFDKEHMEKYGVSSSEEKIANKILDTINLPNVNGTNNIPFNNFSNNYKVSPADELLKYAELQEKGLLSMDEFNRLKKKLLGGII